MHDTTERADSPRLVREATTWLADAISRAPDDAWDLPARGLTWTCRATAGHLLDDLVAYALQLAGARDGRGAQDDYLPVVPPRGGEDLMAVDPASGTAGIAVTVRAFGELFAATVAATGEDVRAYHPWGRTDRDGYTAIGLLEVLVHGWDLLGGLGLDDRVPEGPAAAAVARLFPDAPPGPPVDVLLWCTGRAALTGPEGTHPRRTHWRPDASARP